MSYNSNPNQPQWPSPNDPNPYQGRGQSDQSWTGQPNYYPPSGYAPPPNYPPPMQPPYGYRPQSYGYQGLITNKASIGSRFIAILIDSILVSVVVNIVLTPFRLAAWGYFYDKHVDFSTNISGLSQLVILGIYATVMTVYFGGTIGKRVMNLRVVNVDGSTPSTKTYILRYIIGYPVSGVFICLGFIWALFDSQKQGWHDKIANTYVVKG